jgi:hypothetical protein
MFRLLAVTAVAATLLFCAKAIAADMDREIDHLLASVETSDCIFIRNGKPHDSVAAARHLQMKRERGRRYYDSTESFIARIASKSSLTGKPYLIDCPDEAPVEAESWFSRELAEFRAAEK